MEFQCLQSGNWNEIKGKWHVEDANSTKSSPVKLSVRGTAWPAERVPSNGQRLEKRESADYLPER
ncbi:hypothetical protein AURDEDRAFT_116644 [Auricularia subglabra TFB-10046 SS5]|uniref:Uncharacterized protein n=1 Tax=Auricularia subglabra (strain TFB-10046 / SS5) TaxID=717982 RepID=J0D0V3_AURST|nr:hypothetical protein AURDEDRAFT_116644 [Auricularia subglabra TFB-10046 SS5]